MQDPGSAGEQVDQSAVKSKQQKINQSLIWACQSYASNNSAAAAASGSVLSY